MMPALLGPSAFNTAFFFQQVHFAAVKGWDHLSLVSFFPLYTGAAVLAMLASGWALDRFGTPRLIWFYQLPMSFAFLCFAFGQSQMMFVTGLLFLAITAGANTTLPNAFWAEFYGTRYLGAIKSLATAIMVLGSALGPGITGVMIDWDIGLETQYIAVAIFFVLSTVVMSFGVWRAAPHLPKSIVVNSPSSL